MKIAITLIITAMLFSATEAKASIWDVVFNSDYTGNSGSSTQTSYFDNDNK